jgi:integrase
MKIKLKYVVEDVDRHGNVRVYFRRKGELKVRLPGLPGTTEFMDAYRQAVAGQALAQVSGSSVGRKPGVSTMRWLVETYYGSAEFKRLDARTQRVRRLVLDRFCVADGNGAKPYRQLLPRHIRRFRDDRADRPEAANSLVKYLRQVFAVAVSNDLMDRNPAREVPYLQSGSTGFHSWAIEEVKQFEERHPIGCKARLAMALLLYTGQRRSDVVEMGAQHVHDGWLRFTQVKNRSRRPVTMEIPIIPALQAIIDVTPSDGKSFLATAAGLPFTANGFGNRFRKWCNEAGLPHCSAHGLRKAAAARLAEIGCTEHEIMAVTGHKSLKEVSRYTRAARQKVLAASGMAKFAEDQSRDQSVPLSRSNGESGTTSVAKSLQL